MSIELHKIYKRKKSDRDIFQELMPFKIKEILLIANYYDAYTIEREGQFTDKIVGEYLQVNLYTAPRFTSVASEAEALKILSERHIDLIILMAGLDKQTPLVISRHLKDLYPNICQLMLVNNNSDLAYFHTIEDRLYESIERLFVWNGSTKIFLVMAKYIEDKMNLDRDTHLGDIRVILLVENSIRYYSRYLPLLYTEVMTQTQELIFSEPQDNDMSIVMKIRVRPKVILATNYEEAVYVIDHYRENLIGVISDVRYKRNGEEDEEAGKYLVKAPWPSSGKGILVLGKPIAVKEKERLHGILKRQGYVMLEKKLNKVLDFAMEFCAGRQGVEFIGWSVFSTGLNGEYRGNYLGAQAYIEQLLGSKLGEEKLQSLKQELPDMIAGILPDYRGYLGIDMMIYSDSAGKYRVQPCLEINLRYNMGIVALMLSRRYLDEHAEGEFTVRYYAKAGEAWQEHRHLQQLYPAVYKNNRIKSGYLNLTPVNEATHFVASLICY